MSTMDAVTIQHCDDGPTYQVRGCCSPVGEKWVTGTMWLQGHMEEVDAVATRVDVAARQLDSLRQTSVLEDCFHIW